MSLQSVRSESVCYGLPWRRAGEEELRPDPAMAIQAAQFWWVRVRVRVRV
jgi:hypothetical protein